MSDSFWDDLPKLNIDDLPDIMGDLPISRPRKKSTRRDTTYPAVFLFGMQKEDLKVLRTLDEWLDTDQRICGWREIVDTALNKIEVHEAQRENNRDRSFPLDLLRSNLIGQKLDEVLRGNHQIIQLLGTKYSQGHIRDFNAMLRDFEKKRARYRSDHPWPFIGPPRELDLHKTDDVRIACLVAGFLHDVLVHGYPLLTDQQTMSVRCFPYPPYGISVTNLEGYLIHIKRLLKAEGILGIVGHDTEPQVIAAKSKKPRINRKEANTKAREILKQKPDVKARDLSEEIGCSLGLISKLPVWKAIQEEREKGRKPKMKRLSSKMLTVTGTGKKDGVLNQLIAEQDADEREDERQAKLYINQRKKRDIHD